MSDADTVGDLLLATPRNIRRLYPEHGNDLFGVNAETGDEFSVNPGDYADFADCDDDEPLFGGEAVLALRGSGFQVLTPAVFAEPAYTIVGTHGEGGGQYVVTVYTHNGPEAALTLAHAAHSEHVSAHTGERDAPELQVVAIFADEPKLIDFDREETWPK